MTVNNGIGVQPKSRPALRILVAEDEFLVGLLVEENLKELGHDIIGPFTDLQSLKEAIDRESFDVALLDVNLGGEMVYPVADDLHERGLPFIFSSGYGASNIPERFRNASILAKPYDYIALNERLSAVCRPTV